MSVYLLMADKILGTNASGLNNRGYVQITEQDLNRANAAIHNEAHLLNEVDRLRNELNVALNKYQHSDGKVQTLSEMAEQLILEERDASVKASTYRNIYINDVGSESNFISESTRADAFVKSQFYKLVKKMGFNEGLSVDELGKQMSLNQRYSFNIYITAAADYMMLQKYLSTVCCALSDFIKTAQNDPNSVLYENKEAIDRLTAVKHALVQDVLNYSRVDCSMYKDFHKTRVNEIAESVKLIPGTSKFIESSIPPVSLAAVDAILREYNATAEIKRMISNEHVRKALVENDNNVLIPSAYATNQFQIRSYNL
ncbi:hypothetical protein AEST_01960 [Alishewanella aestuarii B11]|uniref:Uncharacterized protein n=1 Tax=Alishewanella aestuarii B11 TaxID=1197174 RepID=J1YGQ5_9ALTE|nr:hypothetical protein [Alishewanella aestuarii]EJI87155.1 hypothetical protein AEST_01960 [Alishewanella aestuarii B11]